MVAIQTVLENLEVNNIVIKLFLLLLLLLLPLPLLWVSQ